MKVAESILKVARKIVLLFVTAVMNFCDDNQTGN